MTKIIVLNPFTLDTASHSNESALSEFEPTLTVQSDAVEADINYIVRQFGITHELPYGRQVPEYADYTDIPNDYHAAQNFIKAADDTFMTMEASVRSQFNNDAGLFLDFINNPDNYDTAVSYGLVPARVQEQGAEPAPTSEPDKP